MNPEAVKTWLHKKKTTDSLMSFGTSALALLGGLVVLFFTFWFTYAIIWFAADGVSAFCNLAFGHKVHVTHLWRLIGSGVFIVLLFVQHLKTDPWHWGDYPRRHYHTMPGGGLAKLLVYPGASANLIADILLGGPRLVFGSFSLFNHGRKIRRLDITGCADLLGWLADQPKAVSYDELHSTGWDDWLDQLKLIQGVVFLEKGVTLSNELRMQLATLKGT